MFQLPGGTNKAEPVTSDKALKLGVGGSLVLLVTWGFLIINTEHGAIISPVGELLISVIVLLITGMGCIGIALMQFLDIKTRQESFISLIYGLLPVITFGFIFWFLRFVMNFEFA